MKKNKISRMIIATLLITNIGITAFAHGGRTDSSGGHKDNKNKSGLGSYHYHHGEEAHLHTGGVCPYNKNNSTTANQESSIDSSSKDKSNSKNAGYNAGYNDGYAGKVNAPSSDIDKYPFEFEAGYSEGYNKGVEKLRVEEEAIKNKGEDTGYNDGYNGSEVKSGNYKGSHLGKFEEGYNVGYNNGVEKRNLEVQKVKQEAIELGKQDGYIQTKKEKLDYSGKYEEDYLKGYEEGYELGLNNLNEDSEIQNKKAFLLALQGLSLDETIYDNEFVKSKAIEGYAAGVDFKNKYLNVGSLFGSSLENIQYHLKDATKINIGLDELKDDTFIAIDDSNKKKVGTMNIYPKSIVTNGFTKEECNLILKNFFTEEVANSYEHNKSFVSKDNENLKVFRLKRKNRNIKYLPSNLYISVTYENELVTNINISYKRPSKLKNI